MSIQIRPDVQRLEVVRMAFRFTKRTLAAKLGVSPSLLTEIVSPGRNIGVNWRLAGLVQETLGISGNWLSTATGRPLVKEPDEYPAGVVQSLNDFIDEERRTVGFSHVLPVTESPIVKDEVSPLRYYVRDRFVPKEMWSASRYFLQITPGLHVPPTIIPGDYVLIDYAPSVWQGESEPTLFLVKDSEEASLQVLRATRTGPDTIRAIPAAFKVNRWFAKKGSRPRHGRPRGKAKEYGLLGIALMIERDFPSLD